MTAVAVGLVTRYVAGQLGPAAIVIGNGLALSSTAVVLQVYILDVLIPLLKILTISAHINFAFSHFTSTNISSHIVN